MYLVDTNALSITSPGKPIDLPWFAAWLDRNSDRLYLSALTIFEVESGIAKARRTGASRKAETLDRWLSETLHFHGRRILPVDLPVARRAGQLSDAANGLGLDPGLANLLIAGTAAHHRLTVLTRNVRHFAPLGLAVANPYDGLPD